MAQIGSDEYVVASRDQVLTRIRGEFLEMPGLRLTAAQAQRLWGLDPDTCAGLLELLVVQGFLSRGGRGAYVYRRDPGV
jgi:hypothetical protein